jgi:hypothetical protein
LTEQLQVCSEQSIILQTALGTCNSSLTNLNAENAKCVQDPNTMKEKCTQDAPKEPTIPQEPNDNQEEKPQDPAEQQEEKPQDNQEEKPQEPTEYQDIFKDPTENPEDKPQEPNEQQGSKYQQPAGYQDIFKEPIENPEDKPQGGSQEFAGYQQDPIQFPNDLQQGKIQDPNEFALGPDNSKMEEEAMKPQLNEENPTANGSMDNVQDENGDKSQADEIGLKEDEVAAVVINNKRMINLDQSNNKTCLLLSPKRMQ